MADVSSQSPSALPASDRPSDPLRALLGASWPSASPALFQSQLSERFAEAASLGDLHACMAMLAGCPELALDRSCSKAGHSPLHWACSTPSMAPLARALLWLGAPAAGDPSCLSFQRPARWAIDCDSPGALEALLDFDAPLDHEDLWEACRLGHGACVILLLSRRPSLSPLWRPSESAPSCAEALAASLALRPRSDSQAALALLERLLLGGDSDGDSSFSGARSVKRI